MPNPCATHISTAVRTGLGQGLMAASRFPRILTGIVWACLGISRYACRDRFGLGDEDIHEHCAQYDAGRPILSCAFSMWILKLVADAVIQKCDALDGLAIGW